MDRHHHLKGVPPISCKMTVSNFDCTAADFEDFLKYREITIKSCLDNEDADRFFSDFVQEAASRKSVGQLRHLYVECSPPLGVFDSNRGLSKIYTGEKVPTEEKEHQKVDYYVLDLADHRVLLVEVEEKSSYDFHVVDNSVSLIFRTLLEGMMKHSEEDYPRGTVKVIDKLYGKDWNQYQAILDKFFDAMKTGDMKGPQYSDTDDEEVEGDSE